MANTTFSQDSWLYIYNLMRRRKFSEQLSMLIADMVAHETANFTSKLYRNDNNASGIKYINKPFQKATPGAKSKSGVYAKYATLDDWANDLFRILSTYKELSKGKDGSIHIYATNAESTIKPQFHSLAMRWAKVLKQHKYYQDSVNNYYRGLLAAHAAYQPNAVVVANQKQEAVKQSENAPKVPSIKSNTGKKGFMDYVKEIPTGGWVALAFGIGIVMDGR